MSDLTLKQRLYQRYLAVIGRYLDKRQPPADRVTLVQKLIFILPTRYGWWFVLLITLLYLLGTNYQNNLILLLCYLLLSLFLLSIVLVYQNMRGLTLQCRTAPAGFASEKLNAVLQLSADKPHLMLNFSFMQQQHSVLMPGLSAELTLPLPAGRRGKYALPRIKISSQYPFGLWRAWSYVALAQDYWLYPRAEKMLQQHDDSPVADSGQQPQTQSGDILAPYRSGDSLRHMVWKRLARDPQNPVVRQQQFSPEAEPCWVVVTPATGEALERRLSHAAWQLLALEQSAQRYGLKLPGLTLPQSCGAAHLQRCLQELALC
ncbi:DUF58 domain-containing protein [Rheinheimera sp.]|uniref:DUF58 domain-containing protein n=1 Tax=Rheinheimera sp. TaxID=1869214 RepID=UPI0027329122|nr:DUF58 domain-containing protein [Rheinheimera sp.]MDP2713372.1 DUF58 domain-containing protein [Rheinheimera sp.]